MKSKKITAFLAFFFGMLGVHRFYLNQRFRGILYFIVSMFTMMIVIEEGVPLIIIPALVAFIDAILFSVMPQEEFDAKYNKGYERPDFTRRSFRRRRPQQAFASVPAPAPAVRANNTAPKGNPFKKSGVEKYKEYDYEGAIEDFQKALRFKYEDAAVHFNLACCYSISEDVDQAMFHLDKAMEFGFVQLDRIHDHPALAYTRTTDMFETFVMQGYRLHPNSPRQEEVPAANEQQEVTTPAPAEAAEAMTPLPGLLEQISKLGELKDKGVLTEEEFEMQKQRILNS